MESGVDKNEIALIEGTIEDLEESVDQLRHHRESIDADLREKTERLLAWKQRLAKLRLGEHAPAQTRKRKGENFRAIVTLFIQQGNRGLPIADVARALTIPWSSVRATLKKGKDVFFEKNGLWFVQDDLVKKNGDERKSIN